MFNLRHTAALAARRRPDRVGHVVRLAELYVVRRLTDGITRRIRKRPLEFPRNIGVEIRVLVAEDDGDLALIPLKIRLATQ